MAHCDRHDEEDYLRIVDELFASSVSEAAYKHAVTMESLEKHPRWMGAARMLCVMPSHYMTGVRLWSCFRLTGPNQDVVEIIDDPEDPVTGGDDA
jgi:hypothetical protein